MACVQALDPTGEKTARARERQAANIGARERAFETVIDDMEKSTTDRE